MRHGFPYAPPNPTRTAPGSARGGPHVLYSDLPAGNPFGSAGGRRSPWPPRCTSSPAHGRPTELRGKPQPPLPRKSSTTRALQLRRRRRRRRIGLRRWLHNRAPETSAADRRSPTQGAYPSARPRSTGTAPGCAHGASPRHGSSLARCVPELAGNACRSRRPRPATWPSEIRPPKKVSRLAAPSLPTRFLILRWRLQGPPIPLVSANVVIIITIVGLVGAAPCSWGSAAVRGHRHRPLGSSTRHARGAGFNWNSSAIGSKSGSGKEAAGGICLPFSPSSRSQSS